MLIWNNFQYGEYLNIDSQKICSDFAYVNGSATAYITDKIWTEYHY
jgi:hypothetical protein